MPKIPEFRKCPLKDCDEDLSEDKSRIITTDIFCRAVGVLICPEHGEVVDSDDAFWEKFGRKEKLKPVVPKEISKKKK